MLLRVLPDGTEVHRVVDAAEGEPLRASFETAWREAFAAPPLQEAVAPHEARAAWSRLLAADHHVVLLAVDAGEVVAFAVAVPLSAAPEVARPLVGLVPVRHTLYLAALGVRPSAWGRGLARALSDLRLRLVDRARFTHVVLWLPPGHARIETHYRALGFTDTGVSLAVTRPRTDGRVRTDHRPLWSRVLSQVPLDR